MACLIDQIAVFDERGKGQVTCPSSLPEPEEPFDFSVFSVSIAGQNLNYVGIDDLGSPMYAAGGTADNPILPAATFIHDLDGCFFATTFAVGEQHVSMCTSEPDESCPDVPFSESAPEKYADYFDEDGNFVPKAGSGEDCDVTLATLTLKTSGGNEQYSGSNDFVSLITSGGETYFAYNSDSNTGDYVVPLYKGSAIINFSLFDQSTEIEVESGDIELMSHEEDYWSYKLTGDATLVLPYGGSN